MRKLYEQMLEIAVQNSQLLISFADDLIIHDKNQLKSMVEGDQWIWILQEMGTRFVIVPASITSFHWDKKTKEEQDSICDFGFPYVRAALKNDHKSKAFVIAVEYVDDSGEPHGTLTEVSHEEVLRLLVCDRCLNYWQKNYPDHPMHLDLHRLKQLT